ncbi:hypothetical protein BOS5A_110791 [Bosea sp. EC-HK365B]|nr:hypothetical protein BOSE46_50114 [Bosea sp. 46]VVT52573.1 hypothetical protein BOS5A_110791 [Bosea sp. EC-HK365B]VXC48808.1 hypothetical protein BOSE29B_40113 [Bosea sp. 29B]
MFARQSNLTDVLDEASHGQWHSQKHEPKCGLKRPDLYSLKNSCCSSRRSSSFAAAAQNSASVATPFAAADWTMSTVTANSRRPIPVPSRSVISSGKVLQRWEPAVLPQLIRTA